MLTSFLKHHQQLPYYQKGLEPKLLLLSGTHGDEVGSIKSVEKFLQVNHALLPDFLYIPAVSPSAVALGTRQNINGRDVNRQFFEGTSEPEALRVMELLSNFSFSLCLDFHEDYERTTSFYMYDSGRLTDQALTQFRTILSPFCTFYSGLDGPTSDPFHSLINQGYREFAYVPLMNSSSEWLCDSGVSKRTITLEIPCQASQSRKDQITQAIFKFFLDFFEVQTATVSLPTPPHNQSLSLES